MKWAHTFDCRFTILYIFTLKFTVWCRVNGIYVYCCDYHRVFLKTFSRIFFLHLDGQHLNNVNVWLSKLNRFHIARIYEPWKKIYTHTFLLRMKDSCKTISNHGRIWHTPELDIMSSNGINSVLFLIRFLFANSNAFDQKYSHSVFTRITNKKPLYQKLIRSCQK